MKDKINFSNSASDIVSSLCEGSVPQTLEAGMRLENDKATFHVERIYVREFVAAFRSVETMVEYRYELKDGSRSGVETNDIKTFHKMVHED